MKKIEDLLKLDTGNYDTPKKLNRSERQIPRSFVDQIENSEITSETLEQIARAGFPVFRYKTCITIHGAFDLEKLPRIGGYKNLIQNQNGSLEIRYNAIDYDRKKKILRDLRDVSKFGGQIDSKGCTLQLYREITADKPYTEQYTELQRILNRVEIADFYGKSYMFIAITPWGSRVLVIEIVLDAIRAGQVEPFVMAASGLEVTELRERLNECRIERETKEAEYQARRDADKQRSDVIEARRLELAKQLDGKPEMEIAVGSRGAKAISTVRGAVGFKVVEITGKGSFGRFKYRYALIPTLDKLNNGVEWKEWKLQVKPIEIGKYSAV